MKKSIVIGANGQDGSYLSELLLGKGYKVYGVVRRSSTNTSERINHILADSYFELVEGDVIDAACMHRLISGVRPDEVYNLAAQSHVGVSFDQPITTCQINGIGPLNVLEAIRQSSPQTKFYQASTSELYGDTTISPQDENTPFNPNSPYAVAKLYAHHLVGLYRRAYNIFACAGILFNHECISLTTPILVRRNNFIDIIPVGDICVYKNDLRKPQGKEIKDIEVWDKGGWTSIKYITVTRTDDHNEDHEIKCVNSRSGSFIATGHHKAIDSDGKDIRVDALTPGSLVSLVDDFPEQCDEIAVSPEEAELLGYLVGDGYVGINGRQVRFINNDSKLLSRVCKLWRLITGGNCSSPKTYTSSFGGKTTYVDLRGADYHYKILLRNNIYTKDGKKRIPRSILNCPRFWSEFIAAYYMCDGLKSDITGCKYEYQSFKTNSSVLAAGLIYLIHGLTGQTFNINTYLKNKSVIYHVNLHTSNNVGNKGRHLRRCPSEVTKIIDLPREKYVVDIETESSTFNCGVGFSHVHNSERRGEAFVTRKITKYVAMLQSWMDSNDGFPKKDVDVRPLALGNIEAKRDWSHAEDMVRGMWLMMQHPQPDDYVLGSGETHTVKEFLQLAFGSIGLDYNDYVVIDPKFYRPVDVNLLHADPSKAAKVLGWQPTICFGELIDRMVQSDYRAEIKCRV